MNKNLALLIQAKTLQQAEQLEKAKKLYLQILKEEPNNVDALHLFGILHNQLRDFDTAIKYFKKVQQLNPNIPQLYHNLGLAYKEKMDFKNAIECYTKAIALKPNYATAYEKLGNIYASLSEFQIAIDHYQKSLELNPNDADTWTNCGRAFQAWEMLADAQECYEKALKIKPNFLPALKNLAVILRMLNKIEEPIKYLKQVLTLDPTAIDSYISLCSIYDYICYWQDYDERQQKLYQLHQTHIAKDQISPINPMTILSYDWPLVDQLVCAKSHNQSLEKHLIETNQKINFSFIAKQKTRLKIGYISSDFTSHPVAYLTNNLYAAHDRQQFEIFGFSLGPTKDKSNYRQHIAASCDHFIDFFIVKDSDAAKQIYNSGIDILIDLNGHTRGARMNILASRPAPIQAHYLGFLGSTGANFYDYILADEIVIPPTVAATAYSEKPVYLPCYQIFDNQEIISDKPLARKDYDLAEDVFVYCCFNSTYKIQPKIFSIWMEILAKTPKSVLWLYGSSAQTQENLQNTAQRYQIDPKRLIFVKYEERPIYLARYRLANLFLDTPFYNANTTGSDALWAGLPLLTYPTENFAGRGAASALTALGVPELIMPSLEAYRDKAIYFYEHRAELEKIRNKIATNRLTHPLFDTKRTVQAIEQAY